MRGSLFKIGMSLAVMLMVATAIRSFWTVDRLEFCWTPGKVYGVAVYRGKVEIDFFKEPTSQFLHAGNAYIAMPTTLTPRGVRFDSDEVSVSDQERSTGWRASDADWHFAGGGFIATTNYWQMDVPLAWPIAVFVSALAFARWWKYRRSRTRFGLCPVCGYDLRATPERCPECGYDAVKASCPATDRNR
jgi:hypothetical protein